MRDRKQRGRRGSAVVSRPRIASVLATLLLSGACAVADAAARDTRAGFNVRVRILGSGHAASASKSGSSGRAPSQMPSVNTLEFGANTRAGYFVRFEILDPAVKWVEVHGLGAGVRIASGSRDVFVPSSQEGRPISYRVTVRPGIELSVSPPVRATLVP